MDGVSSNIGYVPIDYEHISPERQYRNATVAISSLDVDVPSNLRIAYVPGVGDNVAPSLRQLGIPVTIVQPADIPSADLSAYSTVVVGPRAYQASRELRDNNQYLLAFARNGGTLVVQYGQYEMTAPGMMPFAITIARPHDRVTEENAPVTVLDPPARAFQFSRVRYCEPFPSYPVAWLCPPFEPDWRPNPQAWKWPARERSRGGRSYSS